MAIKRESPPGQTAGSLDSCSLQRRENNPEVAQNSAAGQAPHCILGVDPGLSGAIALYFPVTSDRIIAEGMFVASGEVDCTTLAARGAQMMLDVAIVERVASMPGQGVSSTSKFGTAYGSLRRALGALQVRRHLVTLGVWTRHFRLDGDKEKARALALRSFARTPEHFARKKDHGRVEATLLVLFGSIVEGGGA
jgi:hypothetical protein